MLIRTIRRTMATLLVGLAAAAASFAEERDTMSDTWVAVDGLGRAVSTHAQVGPPRQDRQVGIFYFLWLGEHGVGGPYDITDILAQNPDAMKQSTSPPWGPLHAFHHWGEPLFGYYLSDDRWVLRKHAQMLADAGVDTLIFDVTNQATYKKNYMALLETFADVRRNGGKTPQVLFLAPFGDPSKVVRELYGDLYGPGLYPELWYRWEGKPLIMADPAHVDEPMRSFFTFRKPIGSYLSGPSGPDQWGWLEIYPQHVFYTLHATATGPMRVAEQMTVGIGQNAWGTHTPAAFTEANTRGRSWHNGRKDPAPDAVNYGYNVQEQWKRALSVDPEFIFVTGWNEWVAMRLDEFNQVREPIMFVDQYTQEYSRDIEPMRGGHGDHYYYQLVDYVRRYKGARPAPFLGGPVNIAIDGKFDDWSRVTPVFRDDIGDTAHRDHPGWGSAGQYTNGTGRNDLAEMKVAYDTERVYFYVETAAPLTPSSEPSWMQLLINADRDRATGWEGYDFVVGQGTNGKAVLRAYVNGAWEDRASFDLRAGSKELELAIPRGLLGRDDGINFEFKWADNVPLDGDALRFTLDGDTAPNNRFNYLARTRD